MFKKILIGFAAVAIVCALTARAMNSASTWHKDKAQAAQASAADPAQG